MLHSIAGICLVAACFALLAPSGGAAAAAPEEGVKQYRVGEVTVWAVADSMGDRDMTVFKDADPELIKKIAPGGKAPSAIMTFVVLAGDETVLIDTGLGSPSGDRASRLLPNLAKAGIAPEKVTTVLITHMHADHIGGLAWEGKKAFPNAAVLIGRVELGFWLSDKSQAEFPSRKANFELAKSITDLYAGAVKTFEFGAEVAPGIRALDSVGHTPGHTSFLLESAGGKMMFWGDLAHAAALQFPHPGINASFDMIPEKAAAARARFMDMAAAEKQLIAGMHLPFAGVGRVEKAGPGSYRYIPE